MTKHNESESPRRGTEGSAETREDDRHLQADRTPVPNTASIPAELRQIPQWVVWRRARGRNDKPPFNARTLATASSTDPATWSSFDDALAAVTAGDADGLGFVVTENDGLFFLDFDGVIDDEGTLDPGVQQLVDRFGSYTEVSQSGRGLHIVGRGQKPGQRAKSSRVEMYDRKRYCAMTGALWHGANTSIADCQEALGELYATEFGNVDLVDEAQVATISEDLILDPEASPPQDKLQALLANDRFRATWEMRRSEFHNGTSSHDQSRYDLSLANYAVRSGWSNQEIANLIIAHRRDHGDAPVLQKAVGRPDYIPRTIAKARSSAESQRACKLTDVGNARRLVLRYGDKLRYCAPWKSWLVWSGSRWEIDRTGQITERAKETVHSIYAQAADIPDATRRAEFIEAVRRQESATRIDAMVRLARSEPGVPVVPGQLDDEPWKLNAANGTIDLISGDLLPHNPDDLITKLAPVDFVPRARSQAFEDFL